MGWRVSRPDVNVPELWMLVIGVQCVASGHPQKLLMDPGEKL